MLYLYYLLGSVIFHKKNSTITFSIDKANSLRAAVEGDEAEKEDESTEGGERHGVARHLQGAAIFVKSDRVVCYSFVIRTEIIKRPTLI